MSKSNYLENAVLDHVLGVSAYTQPTLYVALYTSDPTDADSGTEVTGGSYARQVVTFNAASSGSSTNDVTVTFTDMPVATVTHFGIHDAVSAGNLLYHGSLSASKTTASGDDLDFAAGDITISED